MGYCLSKKQRDYVILEKSSELAPAWRSRWDSFCLVLPNWTLQMPDYAYQGDDPDGFLSRDDMVKYLEDFTTTFDPLIRFDSPVTLVEKKPGADTYWVHTADKLYEAENVVVATGTFQAPKIPAFSQKISREVTQLHTSEYHNPDVLPPGAALVVGTGQSGCQVAEELYQSGRKVYLSVGGATRIPRFYRGRDSIYWLKLTNFFDQTADSLPSPKHRFVANPFLSGKNGGYSLDLHQFAKDGVVLLGRLTDAEGNHIFLAPDLMENLEKIDDFVTMVKTKIDEYIRNNHIEAEPAPDESRLRNGYDAEIIEQVDLNAAGISTIIWATGYKFDFSWVKLPILDEYGYPMQTRGVTEYPGLYFLGLHFLYKRRSGLPWGVGEDAAYLADQIELRGQPAPA